MIKGSTGFCKISAKDLGCSLGLGLGLGLKDRHFGVVLEVQGIRVLGLRASRLLYSVSIGMFIQSFSSDARISRLQFQVLYNYVR